MEYSRPMEFWKRITDDICPNIAEYYWISSEGRVYSEKSNKILKNVIIKDYEYIGLYNKDGNQVLYRVNRLVAMAFIPNENSSILQVNHINGNKLENYDMNLEWTTARENVIHSHINGLCRPLVGENNPAAKISDEQAERIAYLLSTGKYSIKEISEMESCSKGIIEDIKNGNNHIALYCKYDLFHTDVPRFNEVFSKAQIRFICQYLQDNSIKELTKEIKLDILNKLGLEYNYQRAKTIYRIFSRQRFQSISNDYSF